MGVGLATRESFRRQVTVKETVVKYNFLQHRKLCHHVMEHGVLEFGSRWCVNEFRHCHVLGFPLKTFLNTSRPELFAYKIRVIIEHTCGYQMKKVHRA